MAGIVAIADSYDGREGRDMRHSFEVSQYQRPQSGHKQQYSLQQQQQQQQQHLAPPSFQQAQAQQQYLQQSLDRQFPPKSFQYQQQEYSPQDPPHELHEYDQARSPTESQYTRQSSQPQQHLIPPKSASPSIVVTMRYERSFTMAMLQGFVRPFGSHMTRIKRPLPAGSQALKPTRRNTKRINVRERMAEGIYLYDLAPKRKYAQRLARQGTRQEEKGPKKRVYYFAGGGWQMPPSSEHWSFLSELVLKLPEVNFTLVSYPLAPNSAAPVSFPQIMTLYRTLMKSAAESGEDVILAGDSSGGNIVLCVVINALLEDMDSKNPNAPCPKALFVMSPSTDLRRQNPEMKRIEAKDPLLRLPFVTSTAERWRAQWAPDDIRVSPLHADLTPLARRGVKVHGLTGGYDILAPDARLFRDRCDQASVQGEWLDWDKQMHCFPLAFSFKLRESKQAKDWIVNLLRRS